MAGQDRPGLLAEVTHLLTHNGCNVRSAAVSAPGRGRQQAGSCTAGAESFWYGSHRAPKRGRGAGQGKAERAGLRVRAAASCARGAQVWTYRGRVAFVLSVTEKGRPVCDSIKLQRLKQLVSDIMVADGQTIVDIKTVRAGGRAGERRGPGPGQGRLGRGRGWAGDESSLGSRNSGWPASQGAEEDLAPWRCGEELPGAELASTGPPFTSTRLAVAHSAHPGGPHTHPPHPTPSHPARPQVRGEIHHDRRLHKLMLKEERMQWEHGLLRSASTMDEEGAAALDAAVAQHQAAAAAQQQQQQQQQQAGAGAEGEARPASRESLASVASSGSPSDSAHSMHGETGGAAAGGSKVGGPASRRESALPQQGRPGCACLGVEAPA